MTGGARLDATGPTMGLPVEPVIALTPRRRAEGETP